MTRARALKSLIRARAAKTGERYTTARRHVMARLQAGRTPDVPPEPTPPPALHAPVIVSSPVGAVTDARCRERTGHDLAHWFGVLDRFGAVQQGHTAAARHLREARGVGSWYSQGITVAYERARGLRAVNERPDGHAFSATKTVHASSNAVVAAFAEARRRGEWASGVSGAWAAAVAAGLDGATSRGFVVKADGQARCRFRWDGSVVEIRLQPKAGGRTVVVVDHGKLASPELVRQRRVEWRAALAALADYLTR